MKILLTGATGFLGSHIAEELLADNHVLILTKRTTSSLSNCKSFKLKGQWINTDSSFWINNIIEFNPDIIIHAAWNGVSTNERDDWKIQLSNINFMYELLKIANSCNIKQFISLGSQAEYGFFEGKINEEFPLNPTTPYGAIKLAVLELLKSYCNDHNINWYWLRIFSIFGERESCNWLIPSVINKMINGEDSMELTKCLQNYDYMYVKDFAKAVSRVINIDANSGIYNVSSNTSIQLKDLLNEIKNIINPKFEFKFGAIPYRKNQSMHIEGDSTKFKQIFGEIETLEMRDNILKVINSYIYKQNENI